MTNRMYWFEKDLGKGKSYRLIANSALFSILLFFYILNFTSVIQPTVYPLIDRVTYVTSFVDKHFINDTMDSFVVILCTVLWFQFSIAHSKKYLIIGTFILPLILLLFLNFDLALKLYLLISFPTLLLFIIINHVKKKNFLFIDRRLIANYVSLLAIGIAAISTFLLITYLVFPEIPLPSLNYLFYFYLILCLFSPFCLVLLSSSFVFVPIFSKIRKKMEKTTQWLHREVIETKKENVKLKTRILHLSFIILLCVVIAMIPHLSTVNKDNQVIGVDTKHYVEILKSIAKSSNYGDLLYKVFVLHVEGDRPFTLLLFLGSSSLFFQGNYSAFLETLPILFGPLLVICVYFLTLRLTGNHLTSIFASLLTIPSHILIAIYGGLYANWLSLIWSYLAILFLFKIMDEPKRINFFIFSTLLVILLFSHTQTWSILIYAIGLFLIVLLFKNRKENKFIVFSIFLSILPSILIDIVKMLWSNNSGMSQEISFAVERDVGLHGIGTIWENLVATSHLTLAGLIGNPIILLLVVYGIYVIQVNRSYRIFFICFFSLFTLPLLFGDRQIQARFFYEIPFQIPAAIALMVLKERLGRYFPMAICIWLIVMSVYVSANFVLKIH